MIDKPSSITSQLHAFQTRDTRTPVSIREHLVQHAQNSFSADHLQTRFSDRLAGAIDSVATAQTEAAHITRAFELGDERDLSKVMVSQQVSSLGFHLTLNVRNKVLSAYKDIMNMPV